MNCALVAPSSWRVGSLRAESLKSAYFIAVLDSFSQVHLLRKKKKAKAKPETSEQDQERERVKALLFEEDDSEKKPSGSGRSSPAIMGNSSRKTEAEKRFEEAQKRRVYLCPFSRCLLILILFHSSHIAWRNLQIKRIKIESMNSTTILSLLVSITTFQKYVGVVHSRFLYLTLNVGWTRIMLACISKRSQSLYCLAHQCLFIKPMELLA